MLENGLMIVETENHKGFRTKFVRKMLGHIIKNNTTSILNKVVKLKMSTVMDNFSIRVKLGKS
jgi:hypothetical protein